MAKVLLKGAIGEALKQVPKSPREKKSADLFAKEMYYQCFRIQNVLQWQSPDVLKKYLKGNPELAKFPILYKFFESYKSKNVKEFIENTKRKTAKERENLLYGLRRIIHKAKIEKTKSIRKAKPQEVSLDRMLKKKLNEDDLRTAEAKTAMPFVTQGKRLDLRKVQSYYGTIVMGQRALGEYADQFQKNYNEAMKKLQAHQKKYKSGWRSYAGIADWGVRKISGLWNWGKSKLGYKRSKTDVEKINSKIKKAREICKEKLERVKAIRKNLAARTKELTEGLSGYKGDLRKKLKELIARGDWAQVEEKRKQNKRQLLIYKKRELTEAWNKAKQNGREVDAARQQTGAVSGALGARLKKIRTGEMILKERAAEVSKRILQMSRVYGEKDPRVIYMKQHVLLPLLKGSDRLKQIKEGTANKLTQVEEKNQRLDILKADIYVGATSAAEEISKLELGIKVIDSRIELVKKRRIELHKLLENIETAYIAVDQFKISTEKNFGTLNGNNTKAVKGLDKQYDYLKSAKAVTPGLGSSLWNTVGVGKWGALGLITLPNRVPRYAGYGVSKLSHWIFGTKDHSFDSTETWTITGGFRYLQKGFDGWLDKGGFKQHQNQKTHWILKGLSTAGNFSVGVLNTGLSLITGVSMIVFEPHIVLDALGNIATDWKTFKETLKSLIHYKDWDKGRYGVATGKTAGDIAILILTAGTGTGAQAGAEGASAAGKVGMAARAGKAASRIGAIAKETARFAWNVPGKVADLAKSIPFAVARGIRTVGGGMLALSKNGLNGFREYMLHVKLERMVTLRAKEFAETIKSMSDSQLARLSPETRKLLERAGELESEGKLWRIVLTDAELATLSRNLSKEFYAGGWFTRQTIEPVARKMQAYMRAKVKHEAGIIELQKKIGIKKTYGSKPKEIFVKPSPEPLPKRAITPEATAIAETFEKTARATLHKQLGVALRTPRPGALDTLKTLVALPYWLPKRFVTRYLRMSESNATEAVNRIMRNKKAFEMATHYNGVLQISEKINQELLKGRLGNALKLYHGARILGHKAGISYAIMDRSFLGYIHRIMPLSVNYVGRISLLHKPVRELGLPPFIKPDTEAMTRIQKEHAALLKETKASKQYKEVNRPIVVTKATRYLSLAKGSLVKAGETTGIQAKRYLRTAKTQVENAFLKARQEATSAKAKKYLDSAEILLNEAGSEIKSTSEKGAKRAKQYLESAQSAIKEALNL